MGIAWDGSTLGDQEQCDQIGRFWQNICLQKQPKKIGDFWASLKQIDLCRNFFGYNLGNFWKHLGNFFTPTPSHTDQEARVKSRLMFKNRLPVKSPIEDFDP